MWNKLKEWFVGTPATHRLIDMTAEDFDGIADAMYKIVDFDLYGNQPEALKALEVIAEAYEDAADILRNA
jgi:hypothetical protein